MASTHKHLRSSTAHKRPTTSIADGQIAINTNSTSPGLFFKDSAGATIIKVGPVHIGTTAPNSSPAAGGSTGNSTGEIWLDTSLTPNGVKIWNGSGWINATPIGSTTVQGLLELATDAETQAGSDSARAVTPASLQSKVSDSVSTTSSSGIASSTAVKTAYDLANAALPAAGGTITGALTIGSGGSLLFEGATNDAFETTLGVVDPTDNRAILLPNISGTLITTNDIGTVSSGMILDGTIGNAEINASAGIVDTKLATISTAGKVANSATTATSANTASGIVARDGSGNFSAGTITAALTGNASTATTLQTARNIQGQSFNGSADITVVTAGSGITVSGTTVTNAGVLSVNGSIGAIANVAFTNAVQSFSVAQRGTVSAQGSVSGTVTLDFATANNFSMTLPSGGTVTLANPSGLTAGQSGAIVITQNASSAALVAYGTNWKFSGGTPTMSTGLSSVSTLVYYVESASRITSQLLTNVTS